MQKLLILLALGLSLVGTGCQKQQLSKEFKPSWIPPTGMRETVPPPVEPPEKKKYPHNPPPVKPPPVSTVKPTTVIGWLALTDLQAVDPRSLGITQAVIYTDPALWWDPNTTEANVEAAVAQIKAASRGMPVGISTWSFENPYTSYSPTTASDAGWKIFLDHLGWWKKQGDWKYYAFDCEEYAPAQPWHGNVSSTIVQQRGRDLANACSPTPVVSAIAFWQVRQGNGVDCSKRQPDGSCLRKPITGYFDFWNQVSSLLFFNEFGLSVSPNTNSATDIKTSLPCSVVIPGVWWQKTSPNTAFNGIGAIAWVYVNPGEILPVPVEANKLKAALH